MSRFLEEINDLPQALLRLGSFYWPDGRERSNAWVKRQLSEAERQLSEAERQLSETERQLSEAERQLSEAERQLSEAERQLSEAERQLSEAERQLSETSSFVDLVAQRQMSLQEARQVLVENIENVLAFELGTAGYVRRDQQVLHIPDLAI
jgi:chromosome segregation ATPase